MSKYDSVLIEASRVLHIVSHCSTYDAATDCGLKTEKCHYRPKCNCSDELQFNCICVDNGVPLFL